MACNWDKEEKILLENLFIENKIKIKDMYKFFKNKSTNNINYYASKMNLKNKRKNIIPEDNKIVFSYKSGSSISKISKELNISQYCVRKILLKNNINIKKSNYYINKKYNINENFFETIDTEEKAYWLGFIYADGSIAIRKGHGSALRICLNNKDKEHLVAFSNAIEYNGIIRDIGPPKTGYVGSSGSSLILISNKKIVSDLIKHGVEIAKSKKEDMFFPTHIEDGLKRHFIRGFFDGDGCISATKRRNTNKYIIMFYICGLPSIINYINVFLSSECSIPKSNITKRKNIKIVYMRYHCLNVSKIRDYIYEKATIFLKRKHDIIFNEKLYCPMSSRFRGVSFSKENKRYDPIITINGKLKHLGYCKSEIQAAKIYDFWSWDLYHDKSKLNFPDNYT